MFLSRAWLVVSQPVRTWMHCVHAWIGWPFQRWFTSPALGGRWVFEKTTPNFWSVLRIPLSIVLGILLSADLLEWALGLFVLGILTDRIDGELARAQKKVTVLGMILDTVSDAVFLSALLLGLAHNYPHQQWPQVVVGLEALRLAGALVIWTFPRWTGRERGLEPNMSGKYKTGLIAVSLLAIFSGRTDSAEDLIVLATGFSLWSMGRHLYDLRRQPRLVARPVTARSKSEPPLAS